MKEKLIEQLKQGDFSNVQLDEWFEYNDKCFEYIYATIEGCKQNINTYMFKFILMYAKKYYFKANNSKSTNDIITKDICEEILKRLIIISYNEPQYKYIIKELGNFPNDLIRLHYCAYIDHYSYLNDSSLRIKKVANIINNYYNGKTMEISKNHDFELHNFLTYAIKYGVIQMVSLYTPTKTDEVTAIKFKSMLFDWNNSAINPNLMNFDVDILYTIPEKGILAAIVLDWIRNGTISFKEGMVPNCFKPNDENPLKKTLKPNN